MKAICRINQTIKRFEGNLDKALDYCKEHGISITRKALEARARAL